MIRAARASEIQEVLFIAKESFRHRDDRFSAAWLVRHLHAIGVRLRVSVYRGEIRGFMLTEPQGGYQLVRAIAVLGKDRGKGIATELLDTLEGPACAWVRCENTASRDMFDGRGWRRKKDCEWWYYTT